MVHVQLVLLLAGASLVASFEFGNWPMTVGTSGSDERDAYENPNIVNTMQAIKQQFVQRYPCAINKIDPITYRHRRDSKDVANIIIKALVTTQRNAEDIVHLEVVDSRQAQKYTLIAIANRMDYDRRLPTRVLDNLKSCPQPSDKKRLRSATHARHSGAAGPISTRHTKHSKHHKHHKQPSMEDADSWAQS